MPVTLIRPLAAVTEVPFRNTPKTLLTAGGAGRRAGDGDRAVAAGGNRAAADQADAIGNRGVEAAIAGYRDIAAAGRDAGGAVQDIADLAACGAAAGALQDDVAGACVGDGGALTNAGIAIAAGVAAGAGDLDRAAGGAERATNINAEIVPPEPPLSPPVPVIVIAPLLTDWMLLAAFKFTPKSPLLAPEPPPVPFRVMPPMPVLLTVPCVDSHAVIAVTEPIELLMPVTLIDPLTAVRSPIHVGSSFRAGAISGCGTDERNGPGTIGGRRAGAENDAAIARTCCGQAGCSGDRDIPVPALTFATAKIANFVAAGAAAGAVQRDAAGAGVGDRRGLVDAVIDGCRWNCRRCR